MVDYTIRWILRIHGNVLYLDGGLTTSWSSISLGWRLCGSSAQWSLDGADLEALPNKSSLAPIWRLCAMRPGYDDSMFEVGTELLLDETGLALVWKLLPRWGFVGIGVVCSAWWCLLEGEALPDQAWVLGKKEKKEEMLHNDAWWKKERCLIGPGVEYMV